MLSFPNKGGRTASAIEMPTVECYDAASASNGLEGLPPLRRLNAAVCDSKGTWHTPRFLLFGFPKCGTSEMWTRLHLHPKVVRLESHKEEHTFDRVDSPIGQPPYAQSWRDEHFESRPTDRFRDKLPTNLADDEVCGDGTPWYAAHRNAHFIALRVRQWAPAASFIVMLRSPVRAWWSLHCMFQRNSLGGDHFRDAGAEFDNDVFRLPLPPTHGRDSCRVRANARFHPDIVQWEGMAMPRELLWAFAERLRVWRASFDRSRFLLLRSDDLGNHEVAVAALARAWQLVGVKPPGAAELTALVRARDWTHANSASGGDAQEGLHCPREAAADGQPRFTSPSAEAVLDAILVYFGREALDCVDNPWPEAQVDKLIADRWVNAAFTEPWVRDARALVQHAKSMRSVCGRAHLQSYFNCTTAPVPGAIPEVSLRIPSPMPLPMPLPTPSPKPLAVSSPTPLRTPPSLSDASAEGCSTTAVALDAASILIISTGLLLLGGLLAVGSLLAAGLLGSKWGLGCRSARYSLAARRS